jgi:hypothetical protein
MRYEALEGGQGVMADHCLTWRYPFPAGLALCTGCGQLITAPQLGGEVCPGTSPLGRKEGDAGEGSNACLPDTGDLG